MEDVQSQNLTGVTKLLKQASKPHFNTQIRGINQLLDEPKTKECLHNSFFWFKEKKLL